MKLTRLQIETIELYLLGEGLISLTFYDEMLDHVISQVEDGIQNGQSFLESFKETKEQFQKDKYAKNIFSRKFNGIKALEMQRLDADRKKIESKRSWAPFNLLLSKNWVLIVLGFVVYLTIASNMGKSSVLITTLLFTLGLSLSMIFIYFREEQPMKRYIPSGTIGSIQKRKEAQLISNMALHFKFKSVWAAIIILPYLVWSFLSISQSAVFHLGWNIDTLHIGINFFLLLILVDHFIAVRSISNSKVELIA